MFDMKVKALVDKEKNRVIFVESYGDFVDILFSFLTMPMGTIIRLSCEYSSATRMGCMNNLYSSIENLDVKHLASSACKTMLLHPQNAASDLLKNLKLKMEVGNSDQYFLCSDNRCTAFNFKLLSCYEGATCRCGMSMNRDINLSYAKRGSVFVNGLSQYLVTDDLQVFPLSTALLSKFGGMDMNALEERTFEVGINEVLDVFKSSLTSKMPLTQTLLKPKAVSELGKKDFDQGIAIKNQMEGCASEGNGHGKNIYIKLIVSKSKNTVCYAEASEDFVNLIFSFLTIPLGYILKKMNGSLSKGCVRHLYNNVQNLDTEMKSLKSDDFKHILLNPKIASGFGYKNQPLDVEEAASKRYYYAEWNNGSTNHNTEAILTLVNPKHSLNISELKLMNPRSTFNETTSNGGFVIGPAMFTVTDNLIITPVSIISVLFLLNKLEVTLSDIEERIVNVGKEEASRLLVAALISKSALTDVFL